MSSMNNLSQDGEFRYILQWFNEWSELQRDDFVPVLVDYLTAAPTTADDLNSNAVYMNGLVHAVNNTELHDRPMSLFQCRMKLFRQWSVKWPQEFKSKLQHSIIEMDSKVGEKLLNDLKTESGVNGILSHASSEDDEQNIENVAVNNNENELNNSSTVTRAAQSIVNSTEAVLNDDSREVSELLNHESFAPVADDSGLDNNSSSETATTSAMADDSHINEPAEPVLIATLATAIPI